MKIGLFGGTFDPIHYGHLILAEEVREALNLDRIIFIPGSCPPHKNIKKISDASFRLKMVRLAIQDNPNFDVSTVEMKKKTPGYTWDTILHFKKEYKKDTLYFIIGSDSLYEMHTWYRIDALAKLCRFAVAARPGFELKGKKGARMKLKPETFKRLTRSIIPMIPIGVSSTQIRKKVAQRMSIRYLVPRKVERWIEYMRLYRREVGYRK